MLQYICAGWTLPAQNFYVLSGSANVSDKPGQKAIFTNIVSNQPNKFLPLLQSSAYPVGIIAFAFLSISLSCSWNRSGPEPIYDSMLRVFHVMFRDPYDDEITRDTLPTDFHWLCLNWYGPDDYLSAGHQHSGQWHDNSTICTHQDAQPYWPGWYPVQYSAYRLTNSGLYQSGWLYIAPPKGYRYTGRFCWCTTYTVFPEPASFVRHSVTP